MPLFAATAYKRRLTDLTATELRQMGVRGLLLDVDNTLTPHDDPHVADDVRRWLSDRAEEGFLLTIVSNNREERVMPFSRMIGLPFTAHAKKPLPSGLLRAASSLGLSRGQCLVIGDQIFTDIVGANLAGMRSVQLLPIVPEEKQRFIRFKRRLERPLLAYYLKKRGIML